MFCSSLREIVRSISDQASGHPPTRRTPCTQHSPLVGSCSVRIAFALSCHGLDGLRGVRRQTHGDAKVSEISEVRSRLDLVAIVGLFIILQPPRCSSLCTFSGACCFEMEWTCRYVSLQSARVMSMKATPDSLTPSAAHNVKQLCLHSTTKHDIMKIFL